jgi:hypothetical protein
MPPQQVEQFKAIGLSGTLGGDTVEAVMINDDLFDY